jgi:translocation and assembly module TamB
MRRIGRGLAWSLGGGIVLLLLVFALLLGALQTGAGRAVALRSLAALTNGQIIAEGLEGRFPDHLRLARLDLSDGKGVWLVGRDLRLDLDLAALFHGALAIERLEAEQVILSRLPASEERNPQPSSPASSTLFVLPLPLRLARLAITHLAIGAEVAGHALDLAVEGRGEMRSLEDLAAHLEIAAHGPGSTASLDLRLTGGKATAELGLDDPAHGLAALWVPLLAPFPLHLQAHLAGPLGEAGLAAEGTLGPLHLHLTGPLDLPHLSGDLALEAQTPDLALIPGLSWSEAHLKGRVFGPLTTPEAEAALDLTALRYQDYGAGSAHLDLRAGDPAIHAEALLRAPELPGTAGELLGKEPIRLEAVLPDRHAPLLRLDLTARQPRLVLALHLAEAEAGWVMRGQADLPDLASLAAPFGVALAGQGRLIAAITPITGTAARDVALAAHLALAGGDPRILALLGPTPSLESAFRLAGDDLTGLGLHLAGRAVSLAAEGALTGGRARLSGHFGLDPKTSPLPYLAAPLAGAFSLAGPTDALDAKLALDGKAALPGFPPAPFHIEVAGEGLPARGKARVALDATLAGAPLSVRLALDTAAPQGIGVMLDHLGWRSLDASGAFHFLPNAPWPAGEARGEVKRLADLTPLLGPGLALEGGLGACLTGTKDGRGMSLELASSAGAAAGVRWEGLAVKAVLGGVPAAPTLAAQADVAKLTAGAVPLRLRLEAKGTRDLLALRLAADGRFQNHPFAAEARGSLDLAHQKATLASLTGSLPGGRLALAAPARLDFANGLALDRLALSWGSARIEAQGRVSPSLDAAFRLDHLTPALITPFFPSLAATGEAEASGRFSGSLAHPEGRLGASLHAFHLATGDTAALPPADFHLEMTLAGEEARLEARLAAGATVALHMAGRLPFDENGAYALTAQGRLDLALLDPVLAAEGRKVGGRVDLDLGLSGTRAAPRLSGTAALRNAEFRDFVQGIDLHDIGADLAGAGENLLIRDLTAKAGQGTITGQGEVGIFAPNLPLSLTLHAAQASPVVSETLTERLDADLALAGAVKTGLLIKGRIKIARAEITIPDSLPPSVATIPVRKADAPPPPPEAPSAAPDLSLDLDLDAPEAVFVHGRGIDAELGGHLHITGAADAPVLTGGLNLIRGQVALGGTSLNFTSGHIGFEGGHRIDPALNLVATSSNGNVTATLTVGGFASDPKITLSSTPPLPQDDILAHLLFGTSASQLSAFQLASIAAGIAQLSGATGGAGNAVNSVRSFLGLDRLTVGTPTNATPGPQAGPGAQQSVPTLEAGRYVAPGVYLGAKQSTTGTNDTAAELQIDLGHGLRLDTTAGSGLGANSVGLTYQRQYGGSGN